MTPCTPPGRTPPGRTRATRSAERRSAERCPPGLHVLADDPPKTIGYSVNVDRRCTICGAVVATVSYAPSEWARRQAKKDAQPDLPLEPE
ncbi:MAG TPA: hypothetical protein VFO16_14030 [Pseudonocardiaceae bacterium]|nr:hypothetical protein [Pseudonocardiaceae bacterium]